MKNEQDEEKCVFGFCFLHPKTKEYDYAVEIGTRKQFEVISKILKLKKVDVFQASCYSEQELQERGISIDKKSEELDILLSFAITLISYERENEPVPKPPPLNYHRHPLRKSPLSALNLC